MNAFIGGVAVGVVVTLLVIALRLPAIGSHGEDLW